MPGKPIVISIDKVLLEGELIVADWNKHDAQAMASHWAADGDVINPWGKWAIGRGNVQKLFNQEVQSGWFNKSISEQDIDSIRFVSPDVAIIDVSATVTGTFNIQGRESGPLAHHVLYVAVKKDGKWQLTAARPYALFEPVTKVQ